MSAQPLPTTTEAAAFSPPPLKLYAPDDSVESQLISEFRRDNAELFEKRDAYLCLHLALLLSIALTASYLIVTTPHVWLKIVLGAVSAFCWFSLGNVTIHHHQTHHNAAKGAFFKRLLDLFVAPMSNKALTRYKRAHMNHHTHPLEDTDVDHRYALEHHQRMSRNWLTRIVYFVELTLVGGHVPGQKDQNYINSIPPSEWKLEEYESVKQVEVRKARRNALIAWAIFGVALFLVPGFAWSWIYPLLLIKNWSGFLGQFQHYDQQLLAESRSKHNRTKTYRVPGWLNYLAGGEISGHFVHHIFPDMPYYNVERARRRLMRQPQLVELVVNY